MDSDLQILERVSDAFVALDAQWRYTYVNGVAAGLLGRPASSLVGRLLWDDFPEEAAPLFASACRRALRERVPVRTEEYHEPWDRWIESRIFPSRDGLAVFFTDLTERRRAEALLAGQLHAKNRLRRREAFFRALAEGSADLVVVLEADGTVRYRNPTAVRVLGYAASELTGASAFDLVHPADVARVREELGRLVGDPEAVVSARFRLRHRDGSWRYLEAEGRSLLHDEAVRGVVINARDVTSRVLAEERLRESEERYRLVTRATNDVVWDLDVDAGRLYWGDSLSSAFGYGPREGLHLGWWEERIHADDRTRVLRSFGEAINGGDSVWEGEYRFLRRDGQYARVHDHALIRRDPDGRPVRVIGSLQDLARKREAEDELHALFAAMQDLIFVIDRDGRYRKVARTGRHLLYRPSEELIGRTMHETLPRRQADIVLAGIRTSLDEGRTVVVEYDLTIQGRERWFSTSISPLGVDTTIAVARDITDSKRGEEALRKSEAWFRSLTQNALDLTAVVDAQGRIRYATASGEAQLGYRWAELRHRPLLELVHPEDRDAVAAALERLRDNGTEPLTLTVRIAAKDGSWQVHQAVAQSLLHDPAVRGIVVNSRDVTEQWRLEAQLRQAQKMEAVGRLAGGVAHDFNNVLMAITGFAALLEGEMDPSGAVADYLTEIHKAADRAASLTRQLLAFGRKQALRPKVLSLNTVVEGAGAMLRRLVREDVELVLRLDPGLGACRVDPHQVEQVLMNLVVNATDALPGGGTIEISTRNRTITERDQRVDAYLQPGSYVALAVRDTGHGMDADVLAKIFEPFFTTKGVGKGTGLGLSTVYGIVKQSGGYIAVDSEPGAGSTFTVLLPRVAVEAGKADAAPGRRGEDPLPTGRGTVLLAEDEDAVRLLARLALQKAGYVVLEARDGTEALRIVDEHPGRIDLLLTDVIMPNLGGYGLAQRLLEIRPGLRVIYMSGYAGNALREIAPHAPPGSFLSKPISPQELTRRVKEALTVE